MFKVQWRHLLICPNAARLGSLKPSVARPFFANQVSRNLAGAEPFLSGCSAVYLEDMLEAWRRDPTSVHASWNSYFRQVEAGAAPGTAYAVVPRLGAAAAMPSISASPSGGISGQELRDHLAIQEIIRNYQTRGHQIADLDPLGIFSADLDSVTPKQLSLEHYGLSDADLDRQFTLPPSTFIGGGQCSMTLRDIQDRLKAIYCTNIGVEYTYMKDSAIKEWIMRKIETPNSIQLSKEERRLALARLIRGTKFEEFLQKKFSAEKRFGLEGGESLIPCLKTIIDQATSMGVDSIVIGMPHRGRLNVLSNVARMPLEKMLSRFDSNLEPDEEGSGDVKYHLGTSVEKLNRINDKNVRISIVANPSHLEAVDPVVQGKTRAEQFFRGDRDGKKVMSILMHGDAAFSGQGVVFETFHLSELPFYTTHGCVHVVVNNQVGFTTDPRFSRSSPYCTDVARVVDAPIFHVNGDAPEAVVFVAKLAAEFRQVFGKDVVIDIVSYRKHGHNEMDEPMFTQPLMYKQVKKMVPAVKKYAEKLIAEGVVTAAEYEDQGKKYDHILEESFVAGKEIDRMKNAEWLDSPWNDFFADNKEERERLLPSQLTTTGVDEADIVHILGKFSSIGPENFVAHRGIIRILSARATMASDRTVNWAMGEAIAFGSLLKEGVHVRLSGQDVERGTFSHRHHVLHDQNVDGLVYNPLNDLSPDQAEYSVGNSSLSEYGVLGFELGYSMTNPNALVIWEGQFGDFANTAQCIIDQFLSSGQTKWVRQTGLVLLLPHGYEGQGPEHSSARLERFLQMASDDEDVIPDAVFNNEDLELVALREMYNINWIVVNCTTPANFMHVLRRQIKLPFRKPLIVMSPKSLLNHPEARSTFDEMLTGKVFRRVITEHGKASKNPANVKRLIFCSGKVYYDLAKARKDRGLEDKIAIARVEQICPFPYGKIIKEIKKYSSANIAWAQEEHKNQGAWTYVQPRIESAIAHKAQLVYIGRPVSASTATGNKAQHVAEFDAFINDACDV